MSMTGIKKQKSQITSGKAGGLPILITIPGRAFKSFYEIRTFKIFIFVQTHKAIEESIFLFKTHMIK